MASEHVCTCGDCQPEPYFDRCKYQLANMNAAEAIRQAPPHLRASAAMIALDILDDVRWTNDPKRR